MVFWVRFQMAPLFLVWVSGRVGAVGVPRVCVKRRGEVGQKSSPWCWAQGRLSQSDSYMELLYSRLLLPQGFSVLFRLSSPLKITFFIYTEPLNYTVILYSSGPQIILWGPQMISFMSIFSPSLNSK